MADQYRWLGITDECTDCEKCHKANLKSTVVLQYLDVDGNPDGDPVYFGSTCAARALSVKGGGRSVLASARGAHHQTLTDAADARSMLELYGVPESGDMDDDGYRQAVANYRRYNAGVAHWDFPYLLGRVRDFTARRRAAIAAAALIDPVCPMCQCQHQPRKRTP